MTPATDIGLERVTAAPTLPPVYLSNGNPLKVLAECRKVALKADWSLAKWSEFSTSFRSCFSADATPEENEKGLDVVRSHFTVTLGDSFSADPTQWDNRHREAID